MYHTTTNVTLVIVPRDRFSSVVDCTRAILANTPEPVRFVYLDFGYSRRQRDQVNRLVGDKPIEWVACGRTIPMQAFRDLLPRIETPYVAWIDNDTYVTPGWLSVCLARSAPDAEPRASVILPLTLECEGLDPDRRDIPFRNHISHAELRGVEVEGNTYVFDHKPFRRTAPEDLPQEPHPVDFFELHTFFAETDVLRLLDFPDMVVREHIDLGIQLHHLGVEIVCEPASRVHFDNLHARPTWADLRFFFFRWDERLIERSHDLFFDRWGYRFLNEQFLKNWAFRRKVFSVCRFLGMPHGPADFASRVLNRLFRPKLPAHSLGDPLPHSKRMLRVAEPVQECVAAIS